MFSKYLFRCWEENAYTYLSCHYDMPQMNNFGGACLSPLAALIKFSKYDIYRTINRGTVDFLAVTAAASFCSTGNHNFVTLKTPSMSSFTQDGLFSFLHELLRITSFDVAAISYVFSLFFQKTID